MTTLVELCDSVRDAQREMNELAARVKAYLEEGKESEALALQADLQMAEKNLADANDVYMTALMAESAINNATNPKPAPIGMNKRERQRYSLHRAMRAIANDNWDLAPFEREVSDEMARRMGHHTRGLLVPTDLLQSDHNVRNQQSSGDPTLGGYLVPTETLPYIDVLRNELVLQMVGATFLGGLSGNVEIPKVTESSKPYWVGPNGVEIPISQVQFGQLKGTPRMVGARAAFPYSLLNQTSGDIESMIVRDLMASIAEGIDFAGIHGTGTNNEPLGLQYWGIGDVAGGVDGSEPTRGDVIALETEVATANAIRATGMKYLTNYKVKSKLQQTLVDAGSGLFVWKETPGSELNGYGAVVSNQIRSDLTKGSGTNLSAIFFGYWPDLVVLQWGGLEMILDPFTQSTSAQIRATVFAHVDIIVRRAGSFSAKVDTITA